MERTCAQCLEQHATMEVSERPIVGFCSEACRKAFYSDATHATSEVVRLPGGRGAALDLRAETAQNSAFRRELFTVPERLQLVVMAIAPGDEIGFEEHAETQMFYVESGRGLAVVEGATFALYRGTSVIVAGGAQHNIINLSKRRHLRLHTLYAPPHHAAGTVDYTRPLRAADLAS
jgi:mannose-6-phosphate isomerase-like protein (cupin superfamily)